MISTFVIHATGIAAIGLSVTGAIRRCERGLRRQGFVSSLLWACNYALQGAMTGAALSAISAARTGASSLVHGRDDRIRAGLAALFGTIAVATAAFTWHGWTTLLPVASSVLTSYALFFLAGRKLRWALLISALLWMETVWSLRTPEPIISNSLGIAAAALGVWRTRDAYGRPPAVVEGR